LAGAEGFEPSNTGSKVPRLTAWPRPTRDFPRTRSRSKHVFSAEVEMRIS
jgi:hypothetical protein